MRECTEVMEITALSEFVTLYVIFRAFAVINFSLDSACRVLVSSHIFTFTASSTCCHCRNTIFLHCEIDWLAKRTCKNE